METYRQDVKGATAPPSPSMGTIARELAEGLRNLMRSEIYLAKAETKQTVKAVSRQTAMAMGFGVLALLGILPFLAFLVIGLGNLLGGMYWLSSLIVSIVMLTIGGGAAIYSLRNIKKQDFTLPAFRDSLKDERGILNERIQEVSSATSNRRAA